MFRSARWRSDRNKIKAVFKLQFHATQVGQVNVNALVICVVPGDVGKPTARLDKCIIQEGSCRWEHPVYETVKFVRDVKTGKINERTYHFIVSTGSLKSSLVGEVTINFADYAEATKASTVSLPLKNSKSNGVLHVSIQRLQENADQREVEETEDSIKSQRRSLNTLFNGDLDEPIKSQVNEDGPLTILQDGPLNNGTHNTEFNVNCRASNGSDITLSSSDSSSGLNTPQDLGLRNSNILHDPTSFISSRIHNSALHVPGANGDAPICEEHQQQTPRSHWESSADSDHGMTANDSLYSSQERSQQASDIDIEKLKTELVSLARQVDVSEMELQTLRKQIIKECKKGQDLSKEVTCLKEEKDVLKLECEKLKGFQKRMEESKSKNKLQSEGGDPWALLVEVRQELGYEKDLNANLRLQLQKTQESNAELLLAVKDLDELLEQKSRELEDTSSKSRTCASGISRNESDDDEDQRALNELVKEHKDAKETYVLEQKVMDMCSEIEMYRRDKDELEMQMEQLALDYEILKQENHEMAYKLEQSELQEQLKMQYECSSSFCNINELEAQIESLENELEKQSKEHSDSLATINELDNQVKILEEELEKQSQGFEADLEALMLSKVEQEQRAIRAEEALRKTKQNNANTAEKLQEEFRKLSMQMASTFDANEKVAMKALAEATELREQKSQLEEMLQKASDKLQLVKDGYEAKLCELSNQLNLKIDQVELLLMEIDDKSKHLEEQKRREEAASGASLQEIQRVRDELERLITENNLLSEQAEQKETMRIELDQMKTSIKHTEELVQKGDTERNELMSRISLVKEEAEKSREELNRMRFTKDEEETATGLLQAEVEVLKAQCDNLKHTIFEDELEKEKLRKQLFQVKGDLKKKEDAFTSLEKKHKESAKLMGVSDETKTSPRNIKVAQVPNSSKEGANLREKMSLLEAQIKLKETALEASANSFLENERERRTKIEELECRVEELNQNSSSFCDNPRQKFADETFGIASNDVMAEDTTNQNGTASMAEENGHSVVLKSNEAMPLEKETKAFTIKGTDCNADEVLGELVSLKERNKSMETELKEMQERYSEISLKFAEVEGERQQLVMTVRNLKNAKKS